MHRFLDHALRETRLIDRLIGRSEIVGELRVPQAVDEPIRANQKPIAGLMRDRGDVKAMLIMANLLALADDGQSRYNIANVPADLRFPSSNHGPCSFERRSRRQFAGLC